MPRAGVAVTVTGMTDNDLHRSLIETLGNVRDIEAACACLCSCHPRLSTLHGGGTSCPCQLTVAERIAAWDEFIEASQVWEEDPKHQAAVREREVAFSAEATALSVAIDRHGGGAPYVIEGVVDGRAFYLRERHDMWRVCVAADETPLQNPWGDAAVGSVCVAEGVVEWYAEPNWEITALQTAVRSVRGWLAERNCAHVGVTWCSTCGAELDPSWWRGPGEA